MDFFCTDLDNSNIVGEAYGTVLLLGSKGVSSEQFIFLKGRCM